MLSNRRRTYLNYLFENMTYLCTFSVGVGVHGYQSQIFEHSKSGSDPDIVIDNAYCEIYSGNLSQYNKFMFISCSSPSPSSYISDSFFDSVKSECSMILPANFSLSVSNSIGIQMTDSKGGYADKVIENIGTKLVMRDDSILLEDQITTRLEFIRSPYIARYYYIFNIINISAITWAVFGINE